LLLAIKPFQKLEELLHSLKQQKVVIRGNFAARERGVFHPARNGLLILPE
jgi:hypothetical protein